MTVGSKRVILSGVDQHVTGQEVRVRMGTRPDDRVDQVVQALRDARIPAVGQSSKPGRGVRVVAMGLADLRLEPGVGRQLFLKVHHSQRALHVQGKEVCDLGREALRLATGVIHDHHEGPPSEVQVWEFATHVDFVGLPVTENWLTRVRPGRQIKTLASKNKQFRGVVDGPVKVYRKDLDVSPRDDDPWLWKLYERHGYVPGEDGPLWRLEPTRKNVRLRNLINGELGGALDSTAFHRAHKPLFQLTRRQNGGDNTVPDPRWDFVWEVTIPAPWDDASGLVATVQRPRRRTGEVSQRLGLLKHAIEYLVPRFGLPFASCEDLGRALGELLRRDNPDFEEMENRILVEAAKLGEYIPAPRLDPRLIDICPIDAGLHVSGADTSELLADANIRKAIQNTRVALLTGAAGPL